jgi:hypothetical protein
MKVWRIISEYTHRRPESVHGTYPARDREKTRARWASCRRRCGMRLDHWNSAVGAGGGGPLDGLG